MSHSILKGAHSRHLPFIRIEHLWVVLALSTVGIYISAEPTIPNDFWWHLKVGELIATSDIPTTNLFSWSIPSDTPFIYQSWLGEFLFYCLYRLGGLPLIVFTRNMLELATFILVAVEAQRRSGSWRLAAVAVLFAGVMCINNLTTRTQNWSWAPFMLTLWILGRYVEGLSTSRQLFLLPCIMIFWVNAHGAFMMGLLIITVFVVGETLRRWVQHPQALSWERLRPLYLWYGATGMATFINPLSFKVFGYVTLLLSDPSSQGLVIEWQSPTPQNLAGAAFYLGILALIMAFAFARRRPSITDVILVCGLAWQAFNGVRYVIWFALGTMPILMQCLAAPQVASLRSKQHIVPSASFASQRGVGWGNLVIVTALGIAVILFQPWIKPYLPLSQTYQQQFTDLTGAPQLAHVSTPVKATEHLRTAPCAGRLFNEMGYGSYLIWALYPQTHVFIDPRVELYPMELWEDYIKLTRGNRVAELLERYAISCVILDLKAQPRLATAMQELSGWHRTYADQWSEVWRR